MEKELAWRQIALPIRRWKRLRRGHSEAPVTPQNRSHHNQINSKSLSVFFACLRTHFEKRFSCKTSSGLPNPVLFRDTGEHFIRACQQLQPEMHHKSEALADDISSSTKSLRTPGKGFLSNTMMRVTLLDKIKNIVTR